MIRILVTLPLVYILLYLVRLPFVLLGDKVNIWWGSIVAGFGMLPGVALIYGVHLYQQFGFKMLSQDRDPEKERGGPFAALLGFLAVLYFFYFLRGIAILIGFEGPFDSVVHAVGPYINWIFDVPERLMTPLR